MEDGPNQQMFERQTQEFNSCQISSNPHVQSGFIDWTPGLITLDSS